ncbi:hypothetical protein [Streptomyces sp. NPDC053541]|uniref:hypothetical protein n=1 Tax=Streptomyces sp. NPDC053541 TaxID=3365709 RepID=UPI0037CF6A18
MAEPTIRDVLDKVAELKGDLETATVSVKNVEMQRMTDKEKKEAEDKKREEEEKARKDGKDVPEDPKVTISKFKASLIEADPKILTERHLPMNFITKFDSMHEELSKQLSSELWEAAGFDTIGAAVEKVHENNENAWKYWVAALGSLVIPAILGGIGLVLLARFTTIQRAIQGGFFNIVSFLSRGRVASGQIMARNDNGDGWGLQPRTHVEERERLAAAGVPIANLPDEQRLRTLRDAMGSVNSKITTFNTEVRKLPSARSLEKTATAVGKVNTAISAAVPTKMNAVAEKLVKLAEASEKYKENPVDLKELGKFNKLIDKSKPSRVAELARATGKLAGAQRHFKPEKLPDAGNLRTAARAANDLAEAGGNVTQAFNNFRIAVQRADDTL